MMLIFFDFHRLTGEEESALKNNNEGDTQKSPHNDVLHDSFNSGSWNVSNSS